MIRGLPLLLLMSPLVFAVTLRFRPPLDESSTLNQSLIRRVDFVPVEQGLRDLQAPLNMMAASPKIEFVDRAGKVLDHCSASHVSDTGHVLTGGHCVELCLEHAGAIKVVDRIKVIDRERLKTVKCPIRIEGRTIQAEILATNDCRGDDRYSAGSAQIKCDGLDFALLKTELPTAACFQVARSVPSPGTPVAAVGFPPETMRVLSKSRARDADGAGQFMTKGEVIPFQNHCFRDVDPPMEDGFGEKPGDWSFGNPARAEILQRQVASGYLLQTTTDLLPGLSGAGLSDAQTLELVGVARSSILNSALLECRGSGFYTSSAAIRAFLATEYPDLDLGQAFGCDKKAFGPKSTTGHAPAAGPAPSPPAAAGPAPVPDTQPATSR